MRFRHKKLIVIVLAAVLILLNYFFYYGKSNNSRDLEVVFLNVGQADCEFIHYKNKNYLIDGGTDFFYYRVERLLNHYGVQRLDGLFFSHPHNDHIGAALSVLENFGAQTVYMSDFTRNYIDTTDDWTELSTFLSSGNVKVNEISAGDRIEEGELSFEILSPVVDVKDCNEMSSVIRMTYEDVSFMFCGDVSDRTEKILLSSGKEIDSDVLKLAHHGAAGSSCSEFIEAVSPDICVVSSSKNNRYDHPSPLINDYMSIEGIDYYRTDEEGNVIIYSDGQKVITGNADYLLIE